MYAYQLSLCDYIIVRILMMAEVEESSSDQIERLVRSDCATLVSWEDRTPVYTGVSLSTSRLDNGPLRSQRRRRRRRQARKKGK